MLFSGRGNIVRNIMTIISIGTRTLRKFIGRLPFLHSSYMSHVILQKLHQTIKPCLSLNTKTMFTHDMLELVPLFAICTYDMNNFMSSKYHIVEGQAQHELDQQNPTCWIS